MYEALFRWSLVRMALEQSGPTGYRLRRTTAAKTLDPSEKGAVNYFLGLAVCKLFAAKLIDAPWLMHLDVFRPDLNPLLTGRSRPDLVGACRTGGWAVLECKGRISMPDNEAKRKAKEQAQRLVSINGSIPSFHIGGIAYFRSDVLTFFWRDPLPEEPVKRPIEVKLNEDQWRHYYSPVLQLVQSQPNVHRRMLAEDTLMPVEGLDVQVGIRPAVLRLLDAEKWNQARAVAEESAPRVVGEQHPERPDSYEPDGIRVVAGQSWLRPFVDEGSEAL
jgi:hypothetical protein